MRQALRGEIARPPVPLQASPPVETLPDPAPGEAVTDESAASGESADSPPACPPASRGKRFGAMSSLVFLGLAAVAWVAHSLHRDQPQVADVAALTAEAPTSASKVSPSPASMPANPSIDSSTTEPVALRVSTNTPLEYSLWDPPAGVPTPTPAPAPSAAVMPARSATPPPPATAPPPAAKSERRRTQRARAPSPSAPGKFVAHRQKNACSDPSGLVASVMCVVNPCRDARGRISAKCLDRQRAEQVRLSRMELR
jgi:hypothetical protein